jgi:hypothetical protein
MEVLQTSALPLGYAAVSCALSYHSRCRSNLYLLI